ncbi:MAG: DMT family transporter [Burkholderiaceae bacterium]
MTRDSAVPLQLVAGTLYALAAGLMWGLVFVAPVLLPGYPAALQSFGRYLAFGLVALPLACLSRNRLAALTRADWIEAVKLSAIGNIVYYLFLAGAIQRAGAPLPTMIIGTLPVVIAVSANWRDARRDGRLPWRALLPSLVAIAVGIALVRYAEADAPVADADDAHRAVGMLLAIGAVACWTWYPLRNADWLRAHPDRSPITWATAQGIATLPLALVGFAVFWWIELRADPATSMLVNVGGWHLPLGPQPLRFVVLMLAMGLLASWLGTLCWNQASQRLPTALVGQLIVFETLSALAYAYLLRGQWPGFATSAGIGLLVIGVLRAVRLKPVAVAAQLHST